MSDRKLSMSFQIKLTSSLANSIKKLGYEFEWIKEPSDFDKAEVSPLFTHLKWADGRNSSSPVLEHLDKLLPLSKLRGCYPIYKNTLHPVNPTSESVSGCKSSLNHPTNHQEPKV